MVGLRAKLMVDGGSMSSRNSERVLEARKIQDEAPTSREEAQD